MKQKTQGRSLDIKRAMAILDVIAKHYNTTSDELLNNRSRRREYSDPRGFAASVIHAKTGATLISIADFFNRDHSWALYWINRSSDLYKYNLEWRRRANACAEQLLDI